MGLGVGLFIVYWRGVWVVVYVQWWVLGDFVVVRWIWVVRCCVGWLGSGGWLVSGVWFVCEQIGEVGIELYCFFFIVVVDVQVLFRFMMIFIELEY